MTSHSSDLKAKELLALSEEVSRVAESLAHLALEPGTPEQDGSSGGLHDVPEAAVAMLIRARRARAAYLPPDLLGEPVWDMLLHLLHEEMSQCRVSVSSAEAASGTPAPVARRWLSALAERRLIVLSTDSTGQEIVELVPQVSGALRRYVREVVQS